MKPCSTVKPNNKRREELSEAPCGSVAHFLLPETCLEVNRVAEYLFIRVEDRAGIKHTWEGLQSFEYGHERERLM